MDQLPHAAVGIAVFVSDVIPGEPIDEDGSQRLVLTMVGRGIGIQEELATAVEVHGCTLECESVFGDCFTRTSYQTGGPRPSRTASRVVFGERSRVPIGRPPEWPPHDCRKSANMSRHQTAETQRSGIGNCEFISLRDYRRLFDCTSVTSGRGWPRQTNPLVF
jgi:hypothetical protein